MRDHGSPRPAGGEEEGRDHGSHRHAGGEGEGIGKRPWVSQARWGG